MKECFGMCLTKDIDNSTVDYLLDSENIITLKEADGRTRISFKASRELLEEMKRILNAII